MLQRQLKIREKNEPLFEAAAFSAAVHVQRADLGTPFITCWTCWPHTANVVFLHALQVA